MDILDFDLEPRSNSTGKCSDYLEVIDGEYIHDDVIFGPQCGQLDVFHLRTFDKKVFIVWVIQNLFLAGWKMTHFHPNSIYFGPISVHFGPF